MYHDVQQDGLAVGMQRLRAKHLQQKATVMTCFQWVPMRHRQDMDMMSFVMTMTGFPVKIPLRKKSVTANQVRDLW